jgi:hypothetical protein
VYTHPRYVPRLGFPNLTDRFRTLILLGLGLWEEDEKCPMTNGADRSGKRRQARTRRKKKNNHDHGVVGHG